MADSTATPVNGNYAGNGSGPTEQNLAAHNAHNGAGSQSGDDISKEEVGWYFVERYYTTLSKNPDKLFLFYDKRSRSVFGEEEIKVPVCVGPVAIQERMKELDFQDCKVRVTNVDTQESGDNIIIQVIGEISDKSAPHRKFVQSFVLATQTNGYFVLNDIFRYIADEEEEELPVEDEEIHAAAAGVYQEPAPTATQGESQVLTGSGDAAEQEHDAQAFDERLETEAKGPTTTVEAPHVNGTPAEEVEDEVASAEPSAGAVQPVEWGTPTGTDGVEDKQAEDEQSEEPQNSEPSPVWTVAAPAAVQSSSKPAASPKPAAPKTWASLAASAIRGSPSVPVTPSAPAAAAPQNKTPSPSQVHVAATPSPVAAATFTSPPREGSLVDGQQNDGWQSVRSNHARNQSRSQSQGQGQSHAGSDAPRFRAYIKNVYPNVDADRLKEELTKFGEVIYFDISRQKNCAFVDFASLRSFQDAINANPHTIGTDQIFIEERRERPFGFQNRGGGGIRGGNGSENRPGQNRGGFVNRDGRGGFQQRGRGGNLTSRGRGGAQVA